MRLDTVTAEIRPRSDWEAVDLGLAMVRRDFWRGIAVWWLALGIPTVAAGVWLWDHPLLLLTLFWWLKPAGSRMVSILPEPAFVRRGAVVARDLAGNPAGVDAAVFLSIPVGAVFAMAAGDAGGGGFGRAAG